MALLHTKLVLQYNSYGGMNKYISQFEELCDKLEESKQGLTGRYGKLYKFPVSQILNSNIYLIQFYLDKYWILILEKLILNQFLHFKLYKIWYSINSKIS